MFSCVIPDSLNSGGCLFANPSKKKKKKLCFYILSVPDIIVSEKKIITALINATGTSDLCNFTQVHGGSVFISNIRKKESLLHRN